MPTTHELKSHPEFFEKVITGSKPFEIRKNDRNFKLGDFLLLREWNPSTQEYTGRDTERVVTYIVYGDVTEPIFPLRGYCIMGIKSPNFTQDDIVRRFSKDIQELHDMPNRYEINAANDALVEAFFKLGIDRHLSSLTLAEVHSLAHAALFAQYNYNKDKK